MKTSGMTVYKHGTAKWQEGQISTSRALPPAIVAFCKAGSERERASRYSTRQRLGIGRGFTAPVLPQADGETWKDQGVHAEAPGGQDGIER